MRITDSRPTPFIRTLRCDRCSAEADHNGDVGFNNFIQIELDAGWGSVLGDGTHAEVDLCHSCVRRALGPWLRLSSARSGGSHAVSEPLLSKHSERSSATVAETPPDSASTANQRIEAAMVRRAREAVLRSGDFVTASVLARVAGFSPHNPDAQLQRWAKQGRIFSIHHDGVDLFPLYALDRERHLRPIPELAEIIEILRPYWGAWGMAGWFLAVNSYLGAKRPQDLLASDPARVIAAAADGVRPIEHG